jgi:hypothetical protein
MNGYQTTKRTWQIARTFFKNISNYGKVVPNGIKKTGSMLIAMGEKKRVISPLLKGIATSQRFNRGTVYELAWKNVAEEKKLIFVERNETWWSREDKQLSRPWFEKIDSI